MTDGADAVRVRLEEISQFCKYPGNEWTSPAGQGKFGWEEVPYWLRGYVDLGYVLDDQAIIQRANQWLNAVIATQRAESLTVAASRARPALAERARRAPITPHQPHCSHWPLASQVSPNNVKEYRFVRT